MKPFQLSDPAAAELTEAIRSYEQHRAGLGGELFDAISETIDLIRTHSRDRRAAPDPTTDSAAAVNRFPYYVVYRTRDDDIYVVAIAHTSGRPDYGRHRL